jgi:peptidoglycan/LPS O-acetylase OafA/YrhL
MAIVNFIHTSNKLELIFYKSPFTFLLNGNFMVAIFFVLSGFVLSRKYFLGNDINYLISASARRFLRLFIPAAVSIFISFLLIKLSLNYNLFAGELSRSSWLKNLYDYPSSLKHFLQELFYKTMFLGNNYYVNTLWSISYELYGSFLVFGLLFFTHNLKNKLAVFMLLILVVIFADFSVYYIAFILGIIINYMPLVEYKFKLRNNYFIIIVLLILGLLLGGFPSTYNVAGTFYSICSNKFIVSNYKLIHIIGGVFFILSVYLSDFFQKIFSKQIFIFLGKISFSFYLLHPIILTSFSSYIFLVLFGKINSYHICVLLVLLVTILFSFLVSFYFAKFVDNNGVKAANNFYVKYLKKK